MALKRRIVILKLSMRQVSFLRRLLQTHADVCEIDTANICSAIIKKIRRVDSRDKERT